MPGILNSIPSYFQADYDTKEQFIYIRVNFKNILFFCFKTLLTFFIHL